MKKNMRKLNKISKAFFLVLLFALIMPIFSNRSLAAGESDFVFDKASKTIISYRGQSKDLVIPNTIEGVAVEKIGKDAFRRMKIKSIVLPKDLIEIENGAFYYNEIEKIVFPEKLKSIGPASFYNNKLNDIKFNEGLKEIAYAAFQSNKLSKIELPKSIESLGWAAFENNQIESLDLNLPKLAKLEDYVFAKNALSKVTLSEALIKIENRVFSGNRLSEITLPDSVEEIEKDSFNIKGEKPTLVRVREIKSGFSKEAESYHKYELIEDHVNKEELIKRIAQADVDESLYTPESIMRLKDALTLAKSVVKDDKASQEDVNQALNQLDLAIKGLDLIEKDKLVEKLEYVNISIPFERKIILDKNLDEGVERVAKEGKNGVKKLTYKVTYDKDGNEIERIVVAEDVIVEKVDEVVYYGTRQYTGWSKKDGKWYYYENGKMLKSSWRFLRIELPDGTIKKNWKYFNKNGENIIKFFHERNNTHLSQVGPNTEYAKGWYKLGRAWTYYKGTWGVRAEGEWLNLPVKLANGRVEIARKYFNKEGYSVSSFYRGSDNNSYYSLPGPDRYLHYGWKTIGTNKYYFYHPSGRAAVGSVVIGGRSFTFNTWGQLKK